MLDQKAKDKSKAPASEDAGWFSGKSVGYIIMRTRAQIPHIKSWVWQCISITPVPGGRDRRNPGLTTQPACAERGSFMLSERLKMATKKKTKNKTGSRAGEVAQWLNTCCVSVRPEFEPPRAHINARWALYPPW